jgi:hypothetical protein
MATTLTKDNIARSNISAMVPSYWSDLMQVPLRKSLVSEEVADTQFDAKLKKGDTVHYPYLGETASQAYSPGSEITAQDVTATDEMLVVDTMRTVPNYVEDIELLQSNYNYQMDIADNGAYQLKDDIDTAVFSQISAGAISGMYSSDPTANVLTLGTIGAVTAGNEITATSANVAKIFSEVRKNLRAANVEDAGDWCTVIDPDVAMQIELYGTEKGFNVSDSTIKNGYAGDFLGFQVYISNNLPTGGYCYFGRKKMIHLAAQVPPKMTIKDVPKQLGKYLIASTAYGVKTFNYHARRFLAVRLVT